MSLLRSFDDMAKSHLPQIHNFLDVIIRNNLKQPGQKKNDKSKGGVSDDQGEGEEEADGSRVFSNSQQAQVDRAVLQRKGDEATKVVYARRKDKEGAPRDQDAMNQAWKDSPAGKFHDDAKNRMRDGVTSKLQDEERRKQEAAEKARQEKIDKDAEHRRQMVSCLHARTSCRKTA